MMRRASTQGIVFAFPEASSRTRMAISPTQASLRFHQQSSKLSRREPAGALRGLKMAADKMAADKHG